MARPQQADMHPCPVQQELDTIVSLVSNEAKNQQVNILLQPQPVSVIIKADGEKLRQAFLNIVINALQATPQGGSVTISTTVSENGFCEISFHDTGAGIEADKLGKIFEPFYTTKPEGTGLGLAISKKIIENHNGKLLVESEPKLGTTVTVRLPILDNA